jgi:hypothetical protein
VVDLALAYSCIFSSPLYIVIVWEVEDDSNSVAVFLLLLVLVLALAVPIPPLVTAVQA